MKKFTLSLFMMIFTICGTYAQLAFESFEVWPAPGWAIYNDVTDAPQSTVTWAQSQGTGIQAGCNGTYAAYLQRENLLPPNGRPIDWLISPAFTVPTNPILKFCTKLTLQAGQGNEFDIRISENPSQLAYGNYVSLINNSTGTFPLNEAQLMENGDQLQYINKVITIPNSYIGKTCYIAFVMKGVTNQGDRWLIDAVSVDKRCDKPTAATPVFTNPTTFGATLQWVNPSGATSHEIEVVPVAASPTGTGYVVNATTSVVWPAGGAPNLAPATAYKYYVRSLCSPTNPSEWAGPFNFSTVPLGARCGEPLPINNLPFQASNNTGNFGDFVDGAPGTSCNGTANALNGNEVIYRYTATFTGLININLTNNGINTFMFVYTSCENIGTNCEAGGSGNNVPINLNNFAVTQGQSYYIVISTSGSTQTTNYTLTVQAASCTPPTSTPPTAANIGSTTATLAWDPVATGITDWQIVVQPQGSGIPQGAGTDTDNNTSYLAENLQPATAYEYWVRNDCNNGTFSPWAGPYLFTTFQIPVTLNYSQDFETLPSGFSFVSGNNIQAKWVVGSAVNNGGINSLYVSTDNGVTNNYNATQATVIHAYRDVQIPATLGASGEISLSFDWKSGGDNNDYFRVWLVPLNYNIPVNSQITAAANQRIKLGGEYFDSEAWSRYVYTQNVQQFAGQVMRIVFEWRNNNSTENQPPAAIDNIEIKVITCATPTALAVTNNTITTSGATITWTPPASGAAGYDYYVSTNPTAPAADTTPTNTEVVTTPTANLTGLQTATLYYVWVRSNCGDPNGNSFWIGPVQVYTLQIPAPLTFSEPFEIEPIQWTLNNGSPLTQVNKWFIGNATNNGGTKSLYVSADNGTTNSYDETATTIIHAYRDLAIPSGAGEIDLTFDWKGVGQGTTDYFDVYLMPLTYTPITGTALTQAIANNNNGERIGTTFSGAANFTGAGFTLLSSGYAGQNRRLIFQWRSNNSVTNGPPAAIDNVLVKVVTCRTPITLAAPIATITHNTAVLTWTELNTATNWEIYVAPTATAVAPSATFVGTSVPGGQPTYTAPGLTPQTQYSFWVRTDCGDADGKSRWAGPFTFITKPINDECSAAIALTVNPDSYCGVTTQGKFYGATRSTDPITCSAASADDDMWYEFVATKNQHYIAVLNDEGVNGTRLSQDPIYFAVYSGACGGMTQINCTNNIAFPNGPNTILNGLTIGQTYKMRIYTNGTPTTNYSFRICVGVPFTCEENSTYFCANAENNGLTSFLGSVGVPQAGTRGCLTTTPNPTFFTILAQTAGNLRFNIQQFNLSGGQEDVDFIAYGPFTSATAGCASGLNAANTRDCSYSASYTEQVDLLNVQPGQYYTILITNYSQERSNITFTQLPSSTAQSECFCDVNLGPDQAVCGTSVTLNGAVPQVAAGQYKWFRGTEEIIGQTGPTLIVTESGSYTVIANKPICPDPVTDTVVINIGPAVDIPAQITTTICGSGSSATVLLNTFNATVLGTLDPALYTVQYYLTAAAAATATGPIDVTLPFVVSGQPLYVRVFANNSPQCFDTAELIVNIAATPVASISYNGSPYCSNEATGTVTQTGNGGGVYSSTTGLSIDASTGTIDIAASTSGTYTVTYTIAATSTCPELVETAQVSIVDAPTATISYPTPLCSNGTTAQVTQTGTTGGTYTSTAGLVIDPATGEINIAASTFGTYDVTYTIPATADCAPVSIQTQVVITQAATATIDYPMSPYCSNEVTGTVTHTGDVGGVYSSTTGLSIDAATGAIDIAASTPGTYTVTYTIAATATCDEFTTTAQVAIVEAPTATISYTTPLCSNGTAAQVTQTGTTGGTYTSTTGLVIDPATGEINIAASTPGTYDVTYAIAATADCAAFSTQAQVVITQIATATIDYGTGPFCSNGGVISVTQTGTTGGSYTSTAGLSINGTTGDIDLGASTAGTYTVTYTIAATGGCDPVTATASVTVTALPVAAFTYSPAIVCQNVANVAVTLGGGSTAGTFTSGPGLTIDPVTGAITPGTSTPGTYIVTNTIAAANGCPAVSDTFTVTINAAPVATFNYTASPYCKDDGTASPTLNGVAGTFSSTAGLIINASTGQVDLAMSEPGTYTVTNTIAASTECPSFFETATITVIANPDVFVEQGCDGNSYVLEVNFDNDDVYTEDTVTFSWIDPSGNPLTQTGREVIVTATGTYNVVVTPNAAGACAVTVPVQVDNTTCMVQRGISPNNDGKNDTFNLSALDVTKISIFNRYGQEVFSYGAYTDQWHGQGKGGDELPTGTYFYSFERANGEKATGWVYINREEN